MTLFTSETIFSEMRFADDTVRNSIIILPNGDVDIIPWEKESIYAVRLSSFYDNKNHFGKTANRQDAEIAYRVLLNGWSLYLKTKQPQIVGDDIVL